MTYDFFFELRLHIFITLGNIMQLYKTITTDKETGDTGISYQGSQTEASKARSEAKKNGYKAESQTINVPTAKGPLLEWLNENVAA